MEDLTQDYQGTLEGRGVPTNQAKAAAEVLQRQNENPSYEPTEEELHAKQSAWQWLKAKGLFDR
jgi:hypothetical protein